MKEFLSFINWEAADGGKTETLMRWIVALQSVHSDESVPKSKVEMGAVMIQW